MDKELIDLAWRVLPAEFREEAKKEYLVHHESGDMKYSYGYSDALTDFFGIHNLTSDAEGEEMLTVPRKAIIQAYEKSCAKRATKYDVGYADCLYNLFGSKCLPDEEPKQAEPKFKVGDEASYVCSPTLKHKCTVTKVMQNEHSGKWEYNVLFEWGKPGKWIPESDLEPYTEPEASTCTETCTDACSSPCPSQDFDNSFSKERRLTIAAMAMQGLLNATSVERFTLRISPGAIAEAAFEYADALINMNKKGGAQ